MKPVRRDVQHLPRYRAVVYDVAGYGMTGFGHNPTFLMDVLNRPETMANVMTASFAQADLTHALRREIGRNWRGGGGGWREEAERRRTTWTIGKRHLRRLGVTGTLLEDDEDDEYGEEDEGMTRDERAWNDGQLERAAPPIDPPYEAFACLNSGKGVRVCLMSSSHVFFNHHHVRIPILVRSRLNRTKHHDLSYKRT